MPQQYFHEYSYEFFYSLNIVENFQLYLKFKNKYDQSFTFNEFLQFSETVLNKLNVTPSWIESDIIIIPETNNINLLSILEQSNKKVFILKKSTKTKIIQKLEEQSMMKAEKSKLFKILEEMETVKIANIPGNQRKRFIGCLFDSESLSKEKFSHNSKILFLDDSIFSGYTFLAAQHCLSEIPHKNIILFDKQN